MRSSCSSRRARCVFAFVPFDWPSASSRGHVRRPSVRQLTHLLYPHHLRRMSPRLRLHTTTTATPSPSRTSPRSTSSPRSCRSSPPSSPPPPRPRLHRPPRAQHTKFSSPRSRTSPTPSSRRLMSTSTRSSRPTTPSRARRSSRPTSRRSVCSRDGTAGTARSPSSPRVGS